MMSELGVPAIKPIEGHLISLLARGYKAPGIADELHISRAYAYFLMRELRQRFLVLSNPALISRAIEEGIIQPDGTLANSCAQGGQTEENTETVTKIIVLIYTVQSSEHLPLE